MELPAQACRANVYATPYFRMPGIQALAFEVDVRYGARRVLGEISRTHAVIITADQLIILTIAVFQSYSSLSQSSAQTGELFMALHRRRFGPLGVNWASGMSLIMPIRALASRAIRTGSGCRPGATEGTRSLLRRGK